MSRRELDTDQSDESSTEWTKGDLKKLLAAMKTSLPERHRSKEYTIGMRALDWKKVAFHPFSPEACREKWKEVLQKLRKTRTLTELIDEAETVTSCSDPAWSKKVYEGLPTKPPSSGYCVFCQEQTKSTLGVSKGFVSGCAQRWRGLTDSQRLEYSRRCKELQKQYRKDLETYLMGLDKERRQMILKKHNIKPSKVSAEQDLHRRFPGEPQMPPHCRSGNLIFMKEQMQVLKKEYQDSRERFREVCKMWRELSDSKKQRYKQEANGRVKKYSMELQQWFQTLTEEQQKEYYQSYPSKHRLLGVKHQNLAAKQQKFFDREVISHSASKQKQPPAKQRRILKGGEISHRPSDSEDEDLEDSSSDEQEINWEEDEVDEEVEEEEDDVMFDIY